MTLLMQVSRDDFDIRRWFVNQSNTRRPTYSRFAWSSSSFALHVERVKCD